MTTYIAGEDALTPLVDNDLLQRIVSELLSDKMMLSESLKENGNPTSNVL